MDPLMVSLLVSFKPVSAMINKLLHTSETGYTTSNTSQKWRTLQGVAEDTGLTLEEVRQLVAEHPSLFLRQVVGGIEVYKLAEDWQSQLARQEGTTEQQLANELAKMR